MNNLNRKKSGYPLQEKFLEPLYLQQYSKIIEKLNNDINITISEQELANINFKLQTFIEVKIQFILLIKYLFNFYSFYLLFFRKILEKIQ